VVVIATFLGLFSYGFALMTICALRETFVMPIQTALARTNDPLWNDPIAPVWAAVVVRAISIPVHGVIFSGRHPVH
jgi:hypothetical protein